MKMSKYNAENAGSRFVKGRRQEAFAEIEGWVGGSKEQIIKAGAAKVASHPAKSITEQKMLDSYLYEMSKQRFNFIVQCQWQSKLFLQKQKRKTAVMRDLLKNVDVSILSENPFTIRRKIVQADQKRMPRKSFRSKSLPKIHVPSKNMDNYSQEMENVFVTQKFPEVSTNRSNPPTASNLNNRFEQSRGGDWMWPVHDARYLRLNEVLCENYPKIAHLRAKRENINLTAPVPDQKLESKR